MFFTDLALRIQNPEVGILPHATAVIFDEAHELEQVASDSFSITISNRRVASLVSDAIKASRRVRGEDRITKVGEELQRRADMLWAAIPGLDSPGRMGFDTRNKFLHRNHDTYVGVLNSFKALRGALDTESSMDVIEPLVKRCEALINEFRYVFEAAEENAVFWIERTFAGAGKPMNTFVQATPVDVAPFLKDSVFGKFQTVALASATLAVQEKFAHVRRSLGIEVADELIVPSIFDYRNQAILYVPKPMPDPRDASFFESAKEQVTQLLGISEGRAFCLFTSYTSWTDCTRP